MANEKSAAVTDPNNPDRKQSIIYLDPNKDPHRLKKLVTFVPEHKNVPKGDPTALEVDDSLSDLTEELE